MELSVVARGRELVCLIWSIVAVLLLHAVAGSTA